VQVLQLPEVLCIHLKRFRHELMFSSKISSAVSFPLKGLDMRPYLHTDCVSKVTTYELFSVICHYGTAGGGHYISYALNGGQWYEFDDQYVTRVPPEKVQSCEAYVLFYRKVTNTADEVRNKAIKLSKVHSNEPHEVAYVSKQWISR
jgi:ubiquitin carboxyl-terminal hydrolase 20/33